MGVVGQRHSPAALTPVPIVYETGWAQGRSGRVRKISPSTGFDPRTVQPLASRYTDRAIPAPKHKSVPRISPEERVQAAGA